ncbi:MAG TPA: carboxypeptidase-like regulatory domain-containing protein [Vicinamibacterales bacterium]|nr:carboxypeptidase-like regulatory domain-containing protein [Vicinamibacterales bacterium]
MRGVLRVVLLALVSLVLVPFAASAQSLASVTGVVKDTSGAVLPGVTVEVSSPALIEKTRSTVTDGSGLYQIIQLPPGTYTVTFTLTGFSTVKREGLELSGSFVASINAEMKVGAVAETITVTGETPLVDVQSAAVQKVVTKEVVDAIPTGRLAINVAALQPGIILGAGGAVGAANTNSLSTQDVGGTAGDSFTDLSIHGGKPAEQRQTIGGVSAATTIRFGESLSSSPSFTAMQEVAVNTSGADASMAGGGVQMNYVPRDGGNSFKGLMFASGATSGMQGNNYTSGTKDASGACTPADSMFCRGLLLQPGALVHVYDYNPGFGGPLMKDKLWFFGTARWTEAVNQVPNDYPNKNFVVGATSPTLLNQQTLTYVPNTGAPLGQTWGGGGHYWEQTLRLTYQATPKNKFAAYYNNKKRVYTNDVSTTSHEALNTTYFFPFSDNLLQWSSPVSNKFLLEAAFWRHQETWGSRMADPSIADPLAVGVTDNAPISTVPGYTQLINNYHGHVGATDTGSHNPNYRGNFNASYVTGSHAFKTGFDLNGAFRWSLNQSVVPYSYVVSTLPNNGVGAGIPVPTSLSLRSDGCTDPLQRIVSGQIVGGATSIQPGCPTDAAGSPNRVRTEGGAFIQDKWTMNRLTLFGGLRLDWFDSQNPAFHLYPSLLTPLRNYDIPEFSTTAYRDWTPKMGVAYDVFGDGKTALKANLSKYVLGQALVLGGLASQPGYNIQLTSSRTWVDNNHNFVPDCDLTNPASQGPTQSGANQQIDTCLAPFGAAANFYSNSLIPNLAVQDDARYGWGKRPYSWEFSVSVQHELARGISVNGGVYRRWFGNFLVTDDTNHTAADYTAYSIGQSAIPAPPASAGGATLPTTGLNTSGFYNVNDSRPAINLTGLSDTMFPGSNVYDHWFGYDLGISARLSNGILLQGGLSTGHQTTDYCDVEDPAKAGNNALIEMLSVAGVAQSLNTCHMDQKWLPQVKFLGSYTVPKIDVQLGAAYQSIPGVEEAATFSAPNLVVQQSLGRLPTGGVATGATNVALLQPGSNYYTRFNQLDLRLGKILRFAHTRSDLSLDIYNVFNSDVLSGLNASYTSWLAPLSVVPPRLLKVSWTFDF